MRLPWLDLNLLITLDLLLEQRSVSAVATRLGVTQAAVSAQLARLRTHFGDPLFVSSGRGIVPTAFAEQIAEEVQELAGRARTLAAMRQHFDPSQARRRFQIMAGDIDTFLLISQLSRRLSIQAPGVQISIVTDQSDLRKIDFLIVPVGVHRPELPMTPLYEDQYVCLVDRNHPRFGHAISKEDYLDAVHIVRRNGRTGAPSLEAAIAKRMDLKRIEGPIVDAYASVPFLLVGSPYISTVPLRFAQEMERLFPLRIIALPFDFPRQTLALQWHVITEVDMATTWLKAQLCEVAQSIYGPLSEVQSSGSEASAP